MFIAVSRKAAALELYQEEMMATLRIVNGIL
jgi:hypothetical protein